MPAPKPIAQSIFDLSIPEPNSGCWLWLGSLSRDGYANLRSRTGHNLSYRTFVGAIPEGMEIDHKCRVRSCVNPDHLQAITHAENVALADYKSNHRNGRKTHCLRGHELAGANLIREGSARKCRACKTIRVRGRRARLYPGVVIQEIGG